MNPPTNPSQVRGKATTTATVVAIERIINNNSPTVSQKLARSNNNKPIRGRVDYNFFNYCSQCDLKLPKNILRCTICKQKVRTKPWHRSKILQFKRV